MGINLTNEVEDLHTENYKILMKDIEDDKHKWKNISMHGLKKIMFTQKKVQIPWNPY